MLRPFFFAKHQVIPFNPYRPQDNTFQKLQCNTKLNCLSQTFKPFTKQTLIHEEVFPWPIPTWFD
jgi:hypothetical protein